MAYLEINLNGRAQTRELKSDITIGRNDANDVVIEDPTISRKHCKIEQTGDHWTVTDLDSRGGTWIGGWRVTRIALGDGDEICIGQTLVTFREKLGVKPVARSTPALSEEEMLELLSHVPSSGLARHAAVAQTTQREPAQAAPASSPAKPTAQPSWSALVSEVTAEQIARDAVRSKSSRQWKSVQIPRGAGLALIGVTTVLVTVIRVWIGW